MAQNTGALQHTDVLIIGAGMSGIGFAVQLLKQFGTRNFKIIEKSDNLGGTWWVNSYPGCGCDVSFRPGSIYFSTSLTSDWSQVPSHFFSFSFALNPDWSQKFALQSEIHEYFSDVAAQYEIHQHVEFASLVERASWNEVSGTWSVTVRDLQSSTVTEHHCKILISAVGTLSVPRKCSIPGASSFQGRIFHTAQWDHTFNWKDKELVVVGKCLSTHQYLLSVFTPGDRKRLLCHTSNSWNVFQFWSSKDDHAVLPPIALVSRAPKPKIFRSVQVDDEVDSSGHADLQSKVVLEPRKGF